MRARFAIRIPADRAIAVRTCGRAYARVTDLAAPFSISLNSVSKHIRLLERARLVRRRVRGREHILSFNAGPLDAAAVWIETHRALWSQRLELLAALLDEEDQQRRDRTRKRRGRR